MTLVWWLDPDIDRRPDRMTKSTMWTRSTRRTSCVCSGRWSAAERAFRAHRLCLRSADGAGWRGVKDAEYDAAGEEDE